MNCRFARLANAMYVVVGIVGLGQHAQFARLLVIWLDCDGDFAIGGATEIVRGHFPSFAAICVLLPHLGDGADDPRICQPASLIKLAMIANVALVIDDSL